MTPSFLTDNIAYVSKNSLLSSRDLSFRNGAAACHSPIETQQVSAHFLIRFGVASTCSFAHNETRSAETSCPASWESHRTMPNTLSTDSTATDCSTPSTSAQAAAADSAQAFFLMFRRPP